MKRFLGEWTSICAELKTDPLTGLSIERVDELHRTHGYNRFDEPKPVSNFKRALKHFRDVQTIILTIAAILSTSFIFLTGYPPWTAITIWSLIAAGLVIVIKVEKSAERDLSALKKMSSPKAIVVRHGLQQQVDAD